LGINLGFSNFFNGGQPMKTKIKNGYLIFEDSGKLVHRWKAGKKYGVDEVKGMEIHHIDGDKQNNADTNLLLVNKEDHYNIHQVENKREFLSSTIIFLAIIYFVTSLIATLLILPRLISVLWSSVALILVLAVELRYNAIAKTIRRPNQKHYPLGKPKEVLEQENE